MYFTRWFIFLLNYKKIPKLIDGKKNNAFEWLNKQINKFKNGKLSDERRLKIEVINTFFLIFTS